ncbi:MAG TPA: helix-turn-helix transcriptional regulator [Nocardioides sp.]|uniref:helix-turn-helix domain-containing protein n=1 Tax=Nocardioides sp. TaxID=35761 RepID=UPI002F41CDDA
MYPPTVIEVARKRFGASQAQLALWARTQQSSISEYESRRKSPTLEVTERILAVLDFELALRPVVLFETREHPEIGEYVVPERLWSVPMPECFGQIQVLGALLNQSRPQVWDLSVEAERIGFYGWVIGRGVPQLMLESVDGVLLMQVWDRLDLPTVIREAWQPVLDAATAPQDTAPRDPGGFSAWLAGEAGIEWRPVRPRKPRQPRE